MSAQQSGTPPQGRRAVLVSSPHAGNAMRAEQLTALLERVGITVAQSLLVSDLDRSLPHGGAVA